MRIADVTDPLHPLELGSAPIGHAWRVAVSGTTAYVTDAVVNGQYWIRIVDCSDPGHPAETGSILTPGRVLQTDVSGSYLYAAAGDFGLRVIGVSDCPIPGHMSRFGA